MKVLDLFSGLGGWSNYFKARGHEVVTIDNSIYFMPTIRKDMLDVTIEDFGNWRPDLILASPPCERFSLTGPLNLHWKGNSPLTPEAQEAVQLVLKTLELIEQLKPKFWIIENPKGKLGKLDIIPAERRFVTYCSFGLPYMKPTNLWGGFPPSLKLPKPCDRFNPCGHKGVSILPGSLFKREKLAMVPTPLSKLVCMAAEEDLRNV